MTSIMTPIAVCHFLKSKMKIIPPKALEIMLDVRNDIWDRAGERSRAIT
jgi:hypothetical protein